MRAWLLSAVAAGVAAAALASAPAAARPPSAASAAQPSTTRPSAVQPVATGAVADGTVAVAVRFSNTGPIVVLTNRGQTACQVVANALGTVIVTDVTQGGQPVKPLAITPNFDDDLAVRLASDLKEVAPGASVDLPIPVAASKSGPALLTASWSPLLTIGTLYPVDLSKPMSLTASYQAPIAAVSGAPMCVAEAAAATSGRGGGASRSTPWWWFAIGAGVVLLALLSALWWFRRGRKATATVGSALLVLASLIVLDPRPQPAAATITSDPSVSGAVSACLATMNNSDGDPDGILTALQQPGVNVQIILSTGGNGEYTIEGTSFVPWDPNNRQPFGDGIPRDPCDELYHELYHAFEENSPQGVNLFECNTAAGPSGISIKEVNATRAENRRRHNLHHDERTKYGDNALPTGECRPTRPGDQQCHPQRGCEKKPARKAGSTADPHLTTFDGRRYDFQAVGEFVAARDMSATGAHALQIQVRQKPVGPGGAVALNSAVAADVGGDHVEVRLDRGTTLLVNGKSQPLTAPISLPHGGEVIPDEVSGGQRVTIDWPDESYAIINSSFLSLTVWLAPARAGKMSGLFGNFDGDPTNDTPPGETEPLGLPSYESLYPTFADKNRIRASDSLFTYDPGTSTETYTDRKYPPRFPAPARPDQRAWAEQVCRRFGVVDKISLDACVLDLVTTGKAEFAVAAAVSQDATAAFRLTGSRSELHTPPGGTSELAIKATAGQRLFIDVEASTVPNSCGALSLKDPSGKAIASGCIINGSGYLDTIALIATGDYKLVVDPPGDAGGDTYLRVVFPKDQTGPIGLDGAPVTVNIADSGAVGRFTFQATAGDKVYVDAAAATLPNQCGVLSLETPSGKHKATGCVINGAGLIDSTTLDESGTYTIIVDPNDANTGTAILRLIRDHDQTGTIGISGPPVLVHIAQPGAVARLTVAASPGQRLFLNATGATLRNQCGGLAILDASGSVNASGCIINGAGYVDTFAVPTAGVYTVLVDPAEAFTGDVSLQLFNAQDEHGTISLNGASVTTKLVTPGGRARFTFTGTAGQRVKIDVVTSSLPNQCSGIALLDPSGAAAQRGCVINGSGGVDPFTLTSSGTWTVEIDPAEATVGDATIKLVSG
jgi:hypothetical protein